MRGAQKKPLNLTLDSWVIDILIDLADFRNISVSALVSEMAATLATTTGRISPSDLLQLYDRQASITKSRHTKSAAARLRSITGADQNPKRIHP